MLDFQAFDDVGDRTQFAVTGSISQILSVNSWMVLFNFLALLLVLTDTSAIRIMHLEDQRMGSEHVDIVSNSCRLLAIMLKKPHF